MKILSKLKSEPAGWSKYWLINCSAQINWKQ